VGNRERLLLQVAAILHDTGKFVNTKGHYLHSYFIIKNSDIIGLNSQEIEIVAHVAMYHGKRFPVSTMKASAACSGTKICGFQTGCCYSNGDALDRSHRQKFEDLEITLKKDRLTILGVLTVILCWNNGHLPGRVSFLRMSMDQSRIRKKKYLI
jgi:exopolyphosphatase/guanosine-5'-triphosphate,3'-diphosphate pyrophosphatase